MLEENEASSLSEELPINCIEITKDRPEKEIAVLMRKDWKPGGYCLSHP